MSLPGHECARFPSDRADGRGRSQGGGRYDALRTKVKADRFLPGKEEGDQPVEPSPPKAARSAELTATLRLTKYLLSAVPLVAGRERSVPIFGPGFMLGRSPCSQT